MIRTMGLALCIAAATLSSTVHAQSMPIVAPEKAGLSAEGLKAVSAAVKQHIDSKGIPGAIVLVARNGKIGYFEAQGNIDDAAILNKDTVFWVASMTKPIIAVAVQQQMDAGKLKLSDPVSKFIPEFATPAQVRMLKPGSPAPRPVNPAAPPDPNAPKPEYDLVPAEREITIQDLLTHTSGLQSIGIPNESVARPGPEDTLATHVPKLAKASREFQAGTKWAYSNQTGFDVLARIVEITSGQTIDQYVQKNIFNPLGMSSSNFGPRKDLVARTMPLDPRFGKDPCIMGVNFKCGSAGLWSSTEDYAHFAQMLLNRGTFSGKRLLKAQTVDNMAKNHTGNLFTGTVGIPGADKGVAMAISLVTVEDAAKSGLAVPNGSFGWDGVGSRRFWVVPSKQLVIVMMIPSGNAFPVQRDIERTVMAALK